MAVKMMTSICIWNCRGVGGRAFTNLLITMRKRYNFDFLALLETRQNSRGAMSLARRIGFANYEIVEATGFSGGIWCFWDTGVDFTITYKASQVCHGTFNIGSEKSWDLSVVYGHPNATLRRTLWQQLRDIKTQGVVRWCVGVTSILSLAM